MTEQDQTALEFWARSLVGRWEASEYQIHKRPPFVAHSFDRDARFWVVGSTGVSVLHGWHGNETAASLLAEALQAAAMPDRIAA